MYDWNNTKILRGFIRQFDVPIIIAVAPVFFNIMNYKTNIANRFNRTNVIGDYWFVDWGL